ncbi:MAG: hypothetical protein CMM46_00450 [Rhodospirillaceae bacterium]|nr:hypothetical protein [Rhodospirillaceae bacterium]|tara:strand:- start:3031 stop:4188 length:1158 start_codon:yes stop_codon:yes gene_type:complete
MAAIDAERADAFPVENLTDDPTTTFTLPSPWYFKPEVYEKEVEEIFHKSWRVICHASELSEPGNYVTADIHGQGVFAIRGRDGVLRAFYNVCQHRAHELLQGKGTVKAVITCPYHAWAYAPDGGLRSARNSENVKGFDKADFGLAPVRVQEYCGFVFVNLDPDARPMHEWAPGFEDAVMQWFPDVRDVRAASQKNFDIKANWKVVVENAIEGYHFPNSGPCHKELCDIIDLPGTKLEVHPNWFAIISPPGENKTEVYSWPAEGQSDRTGYFITLYLWPDWIIYYWPHMKMISTFLMRPTGGETCVVENAYYNVPGEGDDETTRGALDWFNNGLGLEDAELNEGVQRGIRSKGYYQGRLFAEEGDAGHSEHCVHAFQSWVKDAIRG